MTMRIHMMAGALCAGTLLAIASPAAAGCNINLRVENTGQGPLQVDLRRSASRVKLGTWADFKGRLSGIDNSVETIMVEAGDDFGATLQTDFGCSTKRRFRWALACGEMDRTGTNFVPEIEWETYSPNDHDYTENRNVTIRISRCEADY
jgi:hypothetical protein